MLDTAVFCLNSSRNKSSSRSPGPFNISLAHSRGGHVWALAVTGDKKGVILINL